MFSLSLGIVRQFKHLHQTSTACVKRDGAVYHSHRTVTLVIVLWSQYSTRRVRVKFTRVCSCISLVIHSSLREHVRMTVPILFYKSQKCTYNFHKINLFWSDSCLKLTEIGTQLYFKFISEFKLWLINYSTSCKVSSVNWHVLVVSPKPELCCRDWRKQFVWIVPRLAYCENLQKKNNTSYLGFFNCFFPTVGIQ